MDSPTWNTNGLIVEGIAGTGKSSAIRALLASEAWTKKPYLSSIVLSEHQTQRVLESRQARGELCVQDHLTLLWNIVTMLEQFQSGLCQMDWAERSRSGHKLPFLLERFHFSHVFHFDELEWDHVREIDRRLAALNTKVCILALDRAALRERILGDRKKEWQPYLRGLGDSEEAILDYFWRRQERLLELSRRTQLPCRIIDTSNTPVERVVAETLRFWGL